MASRHVPTSVAEITDGQFAVLAHLSTLGAHTLSALADREGITAPSMNRTVNGLEELGYLTRTEDPDDRRRVIRGPAVNAMFRSFASFNYRVWFIGALVSNIGSWMQSTAQSWVVLTHLTDNDAGAMGLTMALQFAPPLLLVGVTGWVVDRFDRRKLLTLTQVLMGIVSVAIGVLLLTEVMTLGLMYAFAFLTGLIVAFDNPARQTFVTDVVDRELASNAVALNAAPFNSARMIGPAAAGVLIVAIGSGWVFLMNAVTFGGMIIALSLVRTDELQPRTIATGRSRLSEGFRYARTRPDLIVIFVIVFLMGALAMNFPIYASTMALEFGRQADGFGLLSSIIAIGSLAGALMAARRDRARLRVGEIVTYLATFRDRVAQTFRTLSYFDGVHLAARAQAPALFSTALMDEICPPSTVFAAFHAWGSEDRSIEVYPFSGHEGGGVHHRAAQLRWLRDRVG